jgi:hypothetical protein
MPVFISRISHIVAAYTKHPNFSYTLVPIALKMFLNHG